MADKLTLQDILDMTPADVAKLTKAELKPIVQQLGHNVRARQQSFREAQKRGENVYSPANVGLEKSGGSIKTKDLNLNQLRNEFKRARDYLADRKTSTVQGAKEYTAETLDAMGFTPETPKEIISEAWDNFHKMQEEFPTITREKLGAERYSKLMQNIGTITETGDTTAGTKEARIAKAARAAYEEATIEEAAELERLKNGLSNAVTI